MRIAPGLVMVLGVVAGVVTFWVVGVSERPEAQEVPGVEGGQTDDGGQEERVVPKVGVGEIARLRVKVQELEGALENVRRVTAAQKEEIEDLQGRLAPFLEREGISIEAVMALVEELKGQGISAFLQPGKLSKLTSDLRALGKDGVKAVLGMLASEDENERFLAAKLLEDLADPAAAADLARVALEDSSELVAGMASHAVALMGDPGLAGVMRKILDGTERDNVRLNTMFGLVSVGEQKAIDESLAFFRDEKTPIAYKQAVGRGVLLLDKPHVKPIVDLIREQDPQSVALGRMIVDYYKRVGNAACRSALQDIASDAGAPGPLREYALQALQ